MPKENFSWYLLQLLYLFFSHHIRVWGFGFFTPNQCSGFGSKNSKKLIKNPLFSSKSDNLAFQHALAINKSSVKHSITDCYWRLEDGVGVAGQTRALAEHGGQGCSNDVDGDRRRMVTREQKGRGGSFRNPFASEVVRFAIQTRRFFPSGDLRTIGLLRMTSKALNDENPHLNALNQHSLVSLSGNLQEVVAANTPSANVQHNISLLKQFLQHFFGEHEELSSDDKALSTEFFQMFHGLPDYVRTQLRPLVLHFDDDAIFRRELGKLMKYRDLWLAELVYLYPQPKDVPGGHLCAHTADNDPEPLQQITKAESAQQRREYNFIQKLLQYMNENM